MSDRYKNWVRDRTPVKLNYANGAGVHGVGEVIGYVDQPTILVRRLDGTTESWVAALCTPVEDTVTYWRTRAEHAEKLLAAARAEGATT